VATTTGRTGLERAKARYASLDTNEINWQIDVIKLSTRNLARSQSVQGRARVRFEIGSAENLLPADPASFLRVAADISRHLCQLAICDGSQASWIGLEWIGHSGLCRATTAGDDLYSGAPGICLFLAAQAKVSDDDQARLYSIAGLAPLRHRLQGSNAA